MWLTENLAPDFKTIADFRKDNGQAIRALFQEFLRFAMALGLVKFRKLAADSTKLRAQNSGKEVYRKDTIEEAEQHIREKIEEYLKDVERYDEAEERRGLEVNQAHVKAALKELEKLQNRERKIAAIKTRFQENPDLREQYATDSDCRLQNDKGKIRPGYNVQAVVDGERKLIVACDVDRSQSDQDQILLVVDRIREQKRLLGIEEKRIISADSGYDSEKHLLKVLENEQEEVFVSIAYGQEARKTIPGPGYEQKHFCYDEPSDTYRCPAGQILSRVTKNPRKTDMVGRSITIGRLLRCVRLVG